MARGRRPRTQSATNTHGLHVEGNYHDVGGTQRAAIPHGIRIGLREHERGTHSRHRESLRCVPSHSRLPTCGRRFATWRGVSGCVWPPSRRILSPGVHTGLQEPNRCSLLGASLGARASILSLPLRCPAQPLGASLASGRICFVASPPPTKRGVRNSSRETIAPQFALARVVGCHALNLAMRPRRAAPRLRMWLPGVVRVTHKRGGKCRYDVLATRGAAVGRSTRRERCCRACDCARARAGG